MIRQEIGTYVIDLDARAGGYQFLKFSGASDTTEIETRDAHRQMVEYWQRSRRKLAENGAASSFRWQAPIESSFGDGPQWISSTSTSVNVQFVFATGNDNPVSRSEVKKATELVYAWESQGNGKLASFYMVYFVEQSFRRRELEQVNRLLSEVELQHMTEWSMVALLRSSFSARAALPAWAKLLTSVRQTLQTRGKDSERLLRGLNR